MTIQKQTGNVNQHFLRHFTCGVTCVGTYNGTSTLPLPNHNDFLMQYFYYPILPLNLTHLCEDVLHILSPFRQGSVFFPNSDTGCPTFVTLCIQPCMFPSISTYANTLILSIISIKSSQSANSPAKTGFKLLKFCS